jgi:integrase/recombinase XerC
MTREEPMTTTWGRAIADYSDYLAASGAAASTVKLRRYYLARLSASVADPYRVTAGNLTHFQATPGWKPETRKSARSTVCAFYAWAYTYGRISSNPAASLPRVKVPAGIPKPTPVDVVARAVQQADRDGRLMILLAVLAGLRRSEIASLHSRDIVADIVGHSLRITGKGGKTRTVPLHPRLVHELGGREPGFIFPGKDGGHLSALWVGKKLARLLGGGWSGHTLRHRFSTSAYEVAHDLLSVQALMGHSSPTTTKRYTALDDESLRATIRGIAA